MVRQSESIYLHTLDIVHTRCDTVWLGFFQTLLSLRGVTFRPEPPQKTFIRNMLIYGLGGVALPFVGIKAIDLLLFYQPHYRLSRPS